LTQKVTSLPYKVGIAAFKFNAWDVNTHIPLDKVERAKYIGARVFVLLHTSLGCGVKIADEKGIPLNSEAAPQL
jgi:hypothetical protein